MTEMETLKNMSVECENVRDGKFFSLVNVMKPQQLHLQHSENEPSSDPPSTVPSFFYY